MTTTDHQILEVLGPGGDSQITLQPATLIIAGYTGRDEQAVREHIDELAAFGVAPPDQVPMLYGLDPALLTCKPVIEVDGNFTSGEVEPVLLRHRGRWYLGVGSDHTDRELEREDVKRSKAACPKPLGPTFLQLPDDVATGGFDTEWDRIRVTSLVDGVQYQDGHLIDLRTPSDLLPRVFEAIDTNEEEARDVVVFAGTLPLIGGEFRAGTTWEFQLTLPGGVTLSHRHEMTRST